MRGTVKTNRVRGPNFSKDEQMLLCKITKTYSAIIECKKSDGVKQAHKHEAWRKIQETYNSNTEGAPRTVDNLISCYRNMKNKIKKRHSNAKMVLQDPLKTKELINAIDQNGKDCNAVSLEVSEPADVCDSGFLEMQKGLKKMESQHKKAVMGTVGGPPPLGNENELILKLRKLTELDGLYDGDTLLTSQYQESLPDNEKTEPIEYNVKDEINNDAIENLDKSNEEENFIISTPLRINNRRRRKSTPLSYTTDNEKPQKKVTNNVAFIKLAEEKVELVQLQKKLLEKELIIKELEIENKIKENKHKEIMREKELLLLEMKINNLN